MSPHERAARAVFEGIGLNLLSISPGGWFDIATPVPDLNEALDAVRKIRAAFTSPYAPRSDAS